ncbi:BamA/TamA family outer membrane protein [Algoriphagus sp. NF]|mgnify:CR=1 FL=1|jgi:outer membrane protein insertion porin family|uniref:BamA/TamA family outer membrane protein n=1 Tax=Algoriphagus marincola TaxID=264027 RepID=A0ABS7N4M3_9BACT|nr:MULTISPECIES: POTRA domain-containing protein [Algoriphagus]MBY5951288.1 BamA/TamA family outer membrane protein [Algoriphagus marincola]MDE0560529.1 BamA/TamA family outer membrane protein [Algoriphagus sp. NF]
MKRSLLILFCLVWANTAMSQIRLGQSRYSSSKPIDIMELNYSKPQTYRIAEIKAVGLSTLDENAIISLSGLKVDDQIEVPGDAISNALKKLWNQGIIGDVKILVTKVEGEDISLLLDLTERPRFSRVEFTGINKTQESELRDKINIRGRVVREDVLNTSQRNIQKYFVDKGFLNTEVKVAQVRDTTLPNSVKLRFDVDTKGKVKINEIRVFGNEEITDAKIKSKLKKTKEHARVSVFKDVYSRMTAAGPSDVANAILYTDSASKEDVKSYINKNFKLNFFAGSKYIPKEYRNDKDNVVNFYQTKGFRDAKIVTDSIYSFGQDEINIDLEIEEGQKYYYRNIEFNGNFIHPDQVLRAKLGIQKGDVYDREKLEKRLNYDPQKGDDVSSLYQDDGYLFFNIQPVEVNVIGDSIDMEMRIFEGPQVTVNSVNIKGNERTSDHVVMREIRILPGQKFNRALLVRTIRELSQLGYFDPEKINPDLRPNFDAATVDITFELEERPNDQIELSGGWGGFFGFVGTVGLTFNNFSIKNIGNFDKWDPLPVGDGQKLSLRVQANGRSFQNYSISLTEPWFGGKKPNALSFSFNHSVQRQVDFFNPGNFGQELGFFKITGATLGLARRVTWPDDYFSISNSLQFQVYEFDQFGTSFGLSYPTGRSNSLTLNTTIARNNIDNPIYPRFGSNVMLNVAMTPPYSSMNDNLSPESPDEEKYKWLEYHKWMFDASIYTPLFGSNKLVASARAHMGFLGSYGNRIGIIPLERFVMGGDGMTFNNFALGQEIIGLRGYENQSITPGRDTRGTADPDPFGGIVYNKYVMELRFLVSPNPSATIFVLGFAEAGNNWGSYEEFNPYDLKKSAGVGARIFMPAFGLLGVDWGYGFDPIPGQTRRSGPQFHFTIGQQFR